MEHRMTFIVIFSCLLASTLSASIKQSTSEEELDSLISMYMGGLDVNSSKQQLNELLKAECRNTTGSDAAYESIKDTPDIFLTCVLGSFSMDELMGDVERAVMTDKYEDLFFKGCNMTKTAMPCLDSFIKSLEVCMDEEEKQIMKVLMVIARALIDFACSKGVDEIEKIFDVTDDTCIMSKGDEATKCGETFMEKYFTEDSDEMIKNIYNLLTKEEQCVDLVNFESCVIPLFNDCKEKAPIEAGQEIMRNIIEQTPCRGMKGSVAGNGLETNEI